MYLNLRKHLPPLALLLVLSNSCYPRTHNADATYRSEHEITVTAEYMGWACGDFVPQILPTSTVSPTLEDSVVKHGFHFYIQTNIEAPDNIEELSLSGNRFEIRGYFHYKLHDTEKVLVPRFDLTGWRALTPYSTWLREDGELKRVENDESYDKYWDVSLDSEAEQEFQIARKYADCD